MPSTRVISSNAQTLASGLQDGHDVRIALTTILGNADLVLETPGLDARVAMHVSAIRGAGQALLDIARLTSSESRAPGVVTTENRVGPVSGSAGLPMVDVELLARQARLANDRRQATRRASPIDHSAAINAAVAQRPGDPTTTLGRVLLADDSKDNQKLVSYLLHRSGLDVALADDGERALIAAVDATAAGQPFDLILMDLQMPVMDGCAATRAIRERGLTVPIVALTAHALAGDRDRCVRAGCDDYLTKPIDRLALAQMLGRFIPALRDRRPAPIDASAAATASAGPTPAAGDQRRARDGAAAGASSSGASSGVASNEFAGSLPEAVARIARLAADGEMAAVCAAMGPLRGAAAAAGMLVLETRANAVEASIRLGAERRAILDAIEHLLVAMREQTYCRDRTRTHAA